MLSRELFRLTGRILPRIGGSVSRMIAGATGEAVGLIAAEGGAINHATIMRPS